MRQRLLVSCVPAAVALLLTPGCGGLKPVWVGGKVTLDGKPLAGATVSFVPIDENKGRSAGGKTDNDGNFELTTFTHGDGALPGEYKVTVDLPDTTVAEKFYQPRPGEPQDKGAIMMMRRRPEDRQKLQAAQRKAPSSAVPAAYRNAKTTPLREVVPPGGKVLIELEGNR
jgi:hypothetical protein